MPSLHSIIQHIAHLQTSANGQYFPEGIFEAYRQNTFWHYKRADTNVFFTAITVFTLLKIKPLLPDDSQKTVEEIAERAKKTYPLFQNKDGLPTYNFFQTQPPRHFPNGYFMHRFEHFRIPDDVDDTAFIYLTSPQMRQENALWLQEKLAQHANGSKKEIRNTFNEYRHLRAYSTWFGKDMYIEFDACVLCNILYCLLWFGVELDQHGHDSLAYIRGVITSGKHRSAPFRVAHQYPRTVPIIYHVARLIEAFPAVGLEDCRQVLIQDCKDLLSTDLPKLDRIVLETSLIRLSPNEASVVLKPIVELTTTDFDDFYFFIAGMFTAFENPLVYKHIAPLPLTHLRWVSEAYNWALVAENLALREELRREFT